MYIYILLRRNVYVFLGGGFNYFLFSFLFGEDGLKPPTRDQIHSCFQEHPTSNSLVDKGIALLTEQPKHRPAKSAMLWLDSKLCLRREVKKKNIYLDILELLTTLFMSQARC